MKASCILWRDWDWDVATDLLEPLALERPGQIIFAPQLLFDGYAPSSEDQLNQFHAMALLNQQHYFMLWTHDLSAAHAYYTSDPAPYIQAAAGQILSLSVAAGPRLAAWKRYGLGERMTAQEAVAESIVSLRGAVCAGLCVPQGQPLLPNVWLGYWPESRSIAAVAAERLQWFARIPVALRWLFVPGIKPMDFAGAVWGEEFQPIAIASPGRDKFGEWESVIETQSVPMRQIHWVVCGAGNSATAEYVAGQCEQTGTPIWIEGASEYGRDLALQMWPAETGREPLLTPELARRGGGGA